VGTLNWAPYSQVDRAFEKKRESLSPIQNSYPILWLFFFSLGYWFAFHSCSRSFFKMDMLLFPLIELGFQFVKFLILVVGFILCFVKHTHSETTSFSERYNWSVE